MRFSGCVILLAVVFSLLTIGAFANSEGEKDPRCFWPLAKLSLATPARNKEGLDVKKIRGMLLGLHAGDSLGSALEFQPPRPRGQWLTEMSDGQIFKRGEATDDTDLMIALLESLVSQKRLDLYDYGERLVAWLRARPKDIGITTQDSITKIIDGVVPIETGATHERSQANGSLMRVAPLVLFTGEEGKWIDEMANVQARITHGHPTCIICDQLFLHGLNLALKGRTKEVIYRGVIEKSESIPGAEQITDYLSQVVDVPWEELPTSGYVIHSLGVAFWALMRFDNYEDAIVAVVNRGDDSDTAGAIAGSLLGAYYSVDAIPQRFLEPLQRREEIEALIQRFMELP